MKRASERVAAVDGRAHDGLLSGLSSWLDLTKPRISVFVVLAAFAGAFLGSAAPHDLGRIALAALLVGAVAAASCVFNHIIERDLDRLMVRTAQRPLVTGRIGVRDAVIFGTVLASVGTVGLGILFGLLSALLGLATLIAYVLVYTPLKRHTSLNTVVGALPGAMPPLIGYVALAGKPGPWGLMLFGILFAWQFPHFFAIAWLYREDYRRAGMKMLPALPDAEGAAGAQALAYCLVLLPVSFLPVLIVDAGWVYAAVAGVAGLVYMLASVAFARRESTRTARALLWTSLAYLPLVLAAALYRPILGLFVV